MTASIEKFLEQYNALLKAPEENAASFRKVLPMFLRNYYPLDAEKEMGSCVKAENWERLNDLFFQLTRMRLLPGPSSGYDHCWRFWDMLDLAASEGVEAVRRYLPRELRLAQNGYPMYLHGMNLLLCLLYGREEDLFGAAAVVDKAKKFTQTKKPLWERSVVQFLISLWEKDAAGMTKTMEDICASFGKVSGDRAKAMKAQCLNAYGLAVLARELLPKDVFGEIDFQEEKNFSQGYLAWRLAQREPTVKLYRAYPAEAEVLNRLLLAEPGPVRIAQLKLGDTRYSAKDQKVWYEDGDRMLAELLAKL